jgi:hypothetical protein
VAVLRTKYLARIVARDASQVEWINGWIARAMRFIELEAGRA